MILTRARACRIAVAKSNIDQMEKPLESYIKSVGVKGLFALVLQGVDLQRCC